MKKTACLALLALIFLFVPVLARAEYTVAKGDCLSVIGQKTGVKWQEIAKQNKIKKPWIIYPGQKLEVSTTIVSNSVRSNGGKNVAVSTATSQTFKTPPDGQFFYRNPGADPYKGTVEKAVQLLGYPKEVGKLLALQVKADNFSWETVTSGDTVSAMVFGKDKVRTNVVCAWDKSRLLAAKVYAVNYDGKEWQMGKLLVCGNFFSIEPISEIPPVVITSPEPETEPEPEKPVVIEEEKPIFLPLEKTECPVEHEPIVGAGIWGNQLAKGRFAYAEYVLWLKEIFGISCDSEYSIGVGFFSNWEDGESKLSAYKWDAWGIGPQVGVKRTWWEEKDMFRQWQVKGRLLWEDQSGGNSQSGYWMEQDNIKLGLYGEYEHQFDEKWMGVVVAEGWWDLNNSRVSSWAGDQSETREMFGIGAYGQYKFNEDWSVRFGGGPFYQGWDELFGIRISVEVRWRDRLMFGPSLAIFPFGLSSVYEGIYSASDLTTLTGFVRYEFGPDIREWDEKERRESIKKRDHEMFGGTI